MVHESRLGKSYQGLKLYRTFARAVSAYCRHPNRDFTRPVLLSLELAYATLASRPQFLSCLNSG